MDVNKRQEIKNKYILNKIKENIKSITGISIQHIYKSSDIEKKYLELLNEIWKIEFPVLFTKELGNENNEYIYSLYEYLKLPMDNFKWLIPNFDGSSWWMELRIDDLYNFINFYCPSNESINLTFFDMTNNLLFDIEKGENVYEYRIIWL